MFYDIDRSGVGCEEEQSFGNQDELGKGLLQLGGWMESEGLMLLSNYNAHSCIAKQPKLTVAQAGELYPWYLWLNLYWNGWNEACVDRGGSVPHPLPIVCIPPPCTGLSLQACALGFPKISLSLLVLLIWAFCCC